MTRVRWMLRHAVWLTGSLLLTSLLALGASAPAQAADRYVGSSACIACHREVGQAWQNSHHAQAMMAATQANVKGDFSGVQVEHHSQRTRFLRKQGRYFVHTAGADGREQDFEVTHVLGVYPLQQVLIKQPGGRLQALGVAWDARSKAEGGQRWYHLYPDAPPPPGDPLHWSGREQNWNFQCAACHTTGLSKRYDPAKDSYLSRYVETGVGCEGCHGPGAEHRNWALGQRKGRTPNKGFEMALSMLQGLDFAFPSSGASTIAQPLGDPAKGQAADQVCQGCHSRRSQLVAETRPHAPFLDQYNPSLIEPGLYHSDGRIDGEVFEYGSFVQSAMHRAGVTCSNCHEPHTLHLRAQGNALCTQCHLSSHYDQTEHHKQTVGTPAAACVSCHMPGQTYMGVHFRRDHSLRRPGALQAGGEAGNDFARASDLAAGRSDAQALQAASTSKEALLRLGAAKGLRFLPPQQAVPLGGPLLSDGLRAVRIEAAQSLLGSPSGLWTPEGAKALQSATAELIASEQQSAERPESQTNLADIYLRQGRIKEAEQALHRAIVLDARFVPAYVNLADLYRQQQREDQAERLLRQALRIDPQAAPAAQALGLLLVRTRRLPEALPWLEQALRQSPADPRLQQIVQQLRQRLQIRP